MQANNLKFSQRDVVIFLTHVHSVTLQAVEASRCRYQQTLTILAINNNNREQKEKSSVVFFVPAWRHSHILESLLMHY